MYKFDHNSIVIGTALVISRYSKRGTVYAIVTAWAMVR